jgi:Fe-S-cluster containining protein
VAEASLIELRDRELIESVDAALAESARRSGSWLVCRPGCTDCCMGAFEITELDARRLRRGLIELESTDPARAERVRTRAAAFDSAAEDDPCPALDPDTGRCDLYESRPITCRVFGPPVTCGPNAVGVCELCYGGATAGQIAACQVDGDPAGIEASLLIEIGAQPRHMVVADALR